MKTHNSLHSGAVRLFQVRLGCIADYIAIKTNNLENDRQFPIAIIPMIQKGVDCKVLLNCYWFIRRIINY